MKAKSRFLNLVVAAYAALSLSAPPLMAQEGMDAPEIIELAPEAGTEPPAPPQSPAEKIDSYLDRLATADAGEAGRIEGELLILWSKSGSPAMDMLYQRGTDALAAGDARTAVEHLTAVIDHDPGFLAAYDARAAAYYTAGEIGPALADLAHVLQGEPRQYAALSGLAAILEEAGQREKALEAYRAAAAIHPHMPEVNDAITRLSADLEGQEL